MMRLNEAEWLVEPFYECQTRGLAWTIACGSGVDARLVPNWQAAELKWSTAPAGGLVARVECAYDTDLADADCLCLRVSHAADQRVTMTACIDGVDQTVIDRAAGRNQFAEYEGAVHGRRLERLTIELYTESEGDGRASLLWIIAVNTAARARYRNLMPDYDPDWPVFLSRDDTTLAPLLGLFLPDGVDALRRRAASGAYAGVWAGVRERAESFRDSHPEQGVREHLVRPGVNADGRYAHDLGPAVSKGSGISAAAMETCALAGLVENDATLARIALRHALAAAHCGHWDDSFMMTRAGALWDHRAFTAMSVTEGFVRTVDWAGALLTRAAVRPRATCSPGSTAVSQSMRAFGSRLLIGTCRDTSRVWSICCVTVLGRRLRSIGFRLCRARATALSGFATSCPGTSAGTGLARDARESRRGPGPVVSSS